MAIIPVALLCLALCVYSSGHELSKNLTYLTDERRLYHDLFDDYEKQIRPVAHHSEKVVVSFGVALINIADLDERNEIFEGNIWLRKTWTDVQLTWDPKQYGGVEAINVDVNKVWVPDIVLYNSAATSDGYVWYPKVVLMYTGLVIFVPHVRLRAWCSLDMYKFPYDEQVCNLKFGSWTYDSSKVDITFYDKRNDVDLDSYIEHNEWEVTLTKGVRTDKFYECCAESYPDITYTVHLRRKSTFFNHFIVAPGVALMLLIPFMFVLPPHRGEKIFLGIGIMIGIAEVLGNIASVLPVSHPTIPLIGMYYIAGFAIVCLALAMSVVVLNIANSSHTIAVPTPINTLMLGCIGRILCVRKGAAYAVMEDAYHDHSMESGSNIDTGNDKHTTVTRGMARNMAREEWNQLAMVVDRLLLVLFGLMSLILTICLIS